jgi:DNA-binding response OmpR family regulator
MANIAVHAVELQVVETLRAFIRIQGHQDVPLEQAVLTLVDGTAPALSADVPQLMLTRPIRLTEVAMRLARALAAGQVHPLAHGWRFLRDLRQLQHPTQGDIALTDKEAALLALLLEAERGMPREALMRALWGAEALETHTLETHIYRLRQKLESVTEPPARIIAGDQGYRLVVEA